MIATHADADTPTGMAPLFHIPEIEKLAQETPRPIPVADLEPGHILATGRKLLERALVLDVRPAPGGLSVKVLRRPLAGGTAAWRTHHTRAAAMVTGLADHRSFTPELLPAVPMALLPEEPGEGDEIWTQSAVSFDPVATLAYVRGEDGWLLGGGAYAEDQAVRKAVENPLSLASRWYVYRTAGQPLQLYVDGTLHHAKHAGDLLPGDLLPGVGGARHRVRAADEIEEAGRTLVSILFHVEQSSAYRTSAGRYRGTTTGGSYQEYRLPDAVLPVGAPCLPAL